MMMMMMMEDVGMLTWGVWFLALQLPEPDPYLWFELAVATLVVRVALPSWRGDISKCLGL